MVGSVYHFICKYQCINYALKLYASPISTPFWLPPKFGADHDFLQTIKIQFVIILCQMVNNMDHVCDNVEIVINFGGTYFIKC